MADGISIVFATLSIISSVEQIVSIVHKIKRVENAKVNNLLYRLTLQKRRTARWGSRIRALTVDTLESHIEKEDWQTVKSIEKSLDMLFMKTEQRFEKFKALQKRSPAGILARAHLAYGGYEDLKELLDTITSNIDVLYDLAPPFPPGYYQNEHTMVGMDRFDYGHPLLSTTAQGSGVAGHHPDPDEMRRPQRTLDNAQENAGAPLTHDEQLGLGDHDKSEETGISIRTLLDSALQPLVLLAKRKDDEALGVINYRLTVWAAGLFGDAWDLDRILDTNSEVDSLLLNFIQEALITILVCEEQELIQYARSVSARTGSQDLEAQGALNTLTELLAGDDLIEHSLFYKTAILEAQKSDGSTDSNVRLAGQTVEDLFELLPTLDVAQHAACLREERLHAKQAPPLSTLATADAGHVTLNNLQKIREALQEWQSPAIDNESIGTDINYESSFRNVLAHYQKYSQTLNADRQMQIRQELSKVTSDLLGAMEQSEPQTDAKQRFQQSGDVGDDQIQKRDLGPGHDISMMKTFSPADEVGKIPFTKANEQKVQDLIEGLRRTTL